MIRALVFLFCCSIAGAQEIETPQLALIDVHHQQIKDRTNLRKARNQFKAEYESDVKSAALNFSKFVRGFVKDLFEGAHQRFKLGDVALILLGSVARDEASPYTDLECLFLVKKDTVQVRRKCHLAMQYIADRLYLAGEGPESGYDGFFCDKGNFTPLYNPWFYRHSNPGSLVASGQWQGRREMIMTPEKLKSYFALKTFVTYTDKTHKTVPIMALFEHLNQLGSSRDHQAQAMFYACQILRESNGEELSFQQSIAANWVSHIFVAGAKDLYGSLGLTEILTNIIQNNPDFPRIGKRRILETIRRYKYDDIFDFNRDLQSIDFKIHLYRPIEQFLTGLAEVHNIATRNSFDILSTLRSQNLLEDDLLNHISSVISFALKTCFQIQFSNKSHITSVTVPYVFVNCGKYLHLSQNLLILSQQREFLTDPLEIRKHDELVMKEHEKNEAVYNTIQSQMPMGFFAHDILNFYVYVRPSFSYIFNKMCLIVKEWQLLEGRKDGAHQNNHSGGKTK